MKKDDIFIAMGQIDEGFIAQSEKTARPGRTWLKYGSLAACLALISVAFILAYNNVRIKTDDIYKPAGKVISQSESNIKASYATPESGTYNSTMAVKAALREYSGSDVTFFLAIGIFKNNSQLNVERDNSELKTELERLTSLGYHVGISQTWTYTGKSIKTPYNYIAGYFTADELNDFAASGEYGYFFYFADNGDGDPVKADAGIVTDFETYVK